MASAFPSFHGLMGEGAEDFCDNFELACLLANYSTGMMLKAFPLVMKGEAEWWYNNLDSVNKSNWSMLKKMFLDQYHPRESVQELWEALQRWQQEDLQSYIAYEKVFSTYGHTWNFMKKEVRCQTLSLKNAS